MDILIDLLIDSI